MRGRGDGMDAGRRSGIGSDASAPDAAHALRVALAAAAEAGRVLARMRGEAARMQAATKSSRRDLVTAADLAAEAAIVARLRAEFPDHAIEAEESTRDARDDRPRWFVDPLDGTVNYVHGLPAYCVSIALWHRGAPLVAVVHAPALRERFWAVRGGGACAELLDGEGSPCAPPVPLATSACDALDDALVATGFAYKRNELANPNVGNFAHLVLRLRDVRRCGSAALDLAWTASGRLDGYWELHLSPHDVAAGGLLVLEAGGVVSDARGGGDWLRAGHILAAPSTMHALLVRELEV
jgi:myo-inositol-1(or 4)-monophosphatase